MIKFVLGFVAGAAVVLGLVFLDVINPGTVQTASQDPQKGLAQAADNVVQQVKEGAKNLRTNGEAAALVLGKTGQQAVCRREGLTTRHVCRAKEGQLFRVMDNAVLLFKGDPKDLGPDVEAMAKQTFEELAASPEPAPAKQVAAPTE